MRIRRGKSAEKLDTDKRNLKHIKENQFPVRKCYSTDFLDWSRFQEVTPFDLEFFDKNKSDAMDLKPPLYNNQEHKAELKKKNFKFMSHLRKCKSLLKINFSKKFAPGKDNDVDSEEYFEYKDYREKRKTNLGSTENHYDELYKYSEQEHYYEKLNMNQTRNFILTERFIGWKV